MKTKGFLMSSTTESALHLFTNGRLLAVYETANGLF